MARNDTPRQCYLRRWGKLKAKRQSWEQHWKLLDEYVVPGLVRLELADTNKGSTGSHDYIINNTPEWAAGVLASGMMAGITSPARKWFRLATPSPVHEESEEVRGWLYVTERREEQVFARSNLYTALTALYLHLAVPGTGVLFVDEDKDDIIRCYVFPEGTYCLACNDRGQVDTLYRECVMTVRQCETKFGRAALSDRVRRCLDDGDEERDVRVLHVIEPNARRDPRYQDNRNMPWRSVWMESECGNDGQIGFLRESGYEEFPVMAPRWQTTGDDVYGRSPAMKVLGDCKALQTYETKAAEAVALHIAPPTAGPEAMKQDTPDLTAGGTNYVPGMGAGVGLVPVFEVDARAILEIGEQIKRHELRIQRGFFADLFLMLAESDRRQVTAEEVRAKVQEKMLQLGPVLERLNDELLDPLIDRVFAVMLRMGLLPPPPPELAGAELRVEYISLMAQAQMQQGAAGAELLIAAVARVFELHPEAADKIDWDKFLDGYARMVGISPEVMRSEDVVAAIRQARAKQQQAAQAAQNIPATAGAMRDLSGASLEGDNALARLLQTLGPAAAAQAAGPGGGLVQ